MKYLFRYLPIPFYFICEGLFWIMYGIIWLSITLGYFVWHLKFPQDLNKKMDKSLREIHGNGDKCTPRDLKVIRIVIGICILGASLIIFSFINFFVVTLIAFFFLMICFWLILFMAS